jgi:hypothetical protein
MPFVIVIPSERPLFFSDPLRVGRARVEGPAFPTLAMTLEQFRESLKHDAPPAELDLALTGLWWDAKGDWTKAHESAQQDESPRGSRVHAYLHRKEGDASNAAYWYGRAGRSAAANSLADEWREIASALLQS